MGNRQTSGRAVRLVPVLALALIMGACSSSTSVSSLWSSKPPPEEPNKFPATYKDEILLTLSKTLGDPTNVRDGGITDPALRPAGQEQRYASCVRLNERGVDSKYLGVKHRIAWFYGGHLNQLVEAKAGECDNAPYKPFPEVEKLCQSKSC